MERDIISGTDEPYDSTALTVTFDTNTLGSVVSPEKAQRENKEAAITVRAAVQDGRIRGFFSETLYTLEGIVNCERSEILGKTRVKVGASSVFSVGSHHERNPLNPQALARIQGALDLGMLPLQTMATFTRRYDDRFPLFRPDGGHTELLSCMDKVNSLTIEIMNRGFGQEAARKIGLQFSGRRENLAQPELWQQSLGRARGKKEQRKVAEAVAEWADGDSVGAHYGFGIELFCSEDYGGDGPSVLDDNNRKWLTDEYSIDFVTLAELAQRLPRARESE
jgi:hypothetical protein